jgi:hypothetical protein
LVEDKFGYGSVISSEMLWPCQFLDTAFKTDMEQAAELALTKGTTGEDVADGGQRSSVKLTRNKSSFFTCETEITPQAQASSPSLRSDYVSHMFLFLAVSNVISLAPSLISCVYHFMVSVYCL